MIQSAEFPLISVIIPAYNHEQFVCVALDSARQQTYPNIEILIIDDGSTDATAARISEWIGQHQNEVSVNFLKRENRGVTTTLNELIDRSNGKYIATLASDDYLLPNSLLHRYGYLQENPQKMAVFGDSIVVDSRGNEIYKSAIADIYAGNKEKYLTDSGLRREIIQNWSIPGSCLMVHRSLYQQFRYDERLQVEDRDFYLKMVSEDLLGFIEYPVAAYRVHETNVSQKGKNDFIGSVNKFKSLTSNINSFSYRDRLLFIKPILSSFFGIVVYFSAKQFRKSSVKQETSKK